MALKQPVGRTTVCSWYVCMNCVFSSFFFLFTASLTNGNVPPWQSGPSSWSSWLESFQDDASLFAAFFILYFLFIFLPNCVLALTSSMGFILENLCFALGFRVVFFRNDGQWTAWEVTETPPCAPGLHRSVFPSQLRSLEMQLFSVCLKIHVKLIWFFFSTQRVRTADAPRLGSQLPVSLCFPRECIYSGLWFHGLYGFYYSIMYLQSSAPGHKSPLPCLPKIESPMLPNLPYNSWSIRFFIYFMNAWNRKPSRWHFTPFTFFSSIFRELSFQISGPMIYGPFTPCSPSLLKKEVFLVVFFCICASVCWRRNRPWPPSSNPRTSTCTRLISSACASYRLPPFPACHPHPWTTGLLKPTRPNPLILLLRGCPADWSLDPCFFFFFFLPKHSQGSSWHGSILPPQLGLACGPDFWGLRWCCSFDWTDVFPFKMKLFSMILSFDLLHCYATK